jgi:hypothetical protein
LFNYQSEFTKFSPFINQIFLNKNDSKIWRKDEIVKEKIQREDWWHQLCHLWSDYLFCCLIDLVIFNGIN